jgi:hypothetical protein
LIIPHKDLFDQNTFYSHLKPNSLKDTVNTIVYNDISKSISQIDSLVELPLLDLAVKANLELYKPIGISIYYVGVIICKTCKQLLCNTQTVLEHECLLLIQNLIFVDDVVNKFFQSFVDNNCLNDYMYPSVNNVDHIPLLDLFQGFSCSLCGLSNPDLSVMKLHVTIFHPESIEDIIFACMVQKPFDAWIRVNDSNSDIVLQKSSISNRTDILNNNAINDSFDMAIHAVLGEQLVSILKSLNLAVVEKLGVFVCKACNSLYVISDLNLVET